MYKQLLFIIISIIISLGFSSSLWANTKANTFIDNGNGSVTDTATGLTWQQQDDNVGRTHANAITYCQDLSLAGKSDWRLPNIKELTSLVDYRVDRPSIDEAKFPNTNFTGYWSASSRARNSASAWDVNFSDGNVISSDKTFNFFVRCVR